MIFIVHTVMTMMILNSHAPCILVLDRQPLLFYLPPAQSSPPQPKMVDENDGLTRMVSVAHVYWCGVVGEMLIGMFFLTWATGYFAANLKKLPFLVKTMALVLLSDWWLAVNFFFRDFNNLWRGELETGGWCKLSGFMAIWSALGCRMYFGAFAYCAYR